MDKRVITLGLISLAALAALSTGCVPGLPGTVIGSGRVTTENRNVSAFNGLSLSGIGDVTITQGDTEALTVEAEDNLMPYLKTEVRNGTLAIYTDRSVSPTKMIRINLSVKNLNSIDLSGAGNIQAASLKSDRFSVGLSGAGNVSLDRLEAADITSTLTGTGRLKVGGQVTSQAATLGGVGAYDAANLSSRSARVDVSGAGGATVWAQDSLAVTISGVGGVNYYGSPQVQQKVTGLGGVKSLGAK